LQFPITTTIIAKKIFINSALILNFNKRLNEVTNAVTVTSEVLAAVMLSNELLRFYGMLGRTYGITSQKMQVFATNVCNGSNEEYNYPEVAKHSYFIMPQFVQVTRKAPAHITALYTTTTT